MQLICQHIVKQILRFGYACNVLAVEKYRLVIKNKCELHIQYQTNKFDGECEVHPNDGIVVFYPKPRIRRNNDFYFPRKWWTIGCKQTYDYELENTIVASRSVYHQETCYIQSELEQCRVKAKL